METQKESCVNVYKEFMFCCKDWLLQIVLTSLKYLCIICIQIDAWHCVILNNSVYIRSSMVSH